MSNGYTEEQHRFLREYVPGHRYREIIEKYNSRYPENAIDNVRLSNYCKYHNLKTGLSGQFQEGHKSFTKGKKQQEYMSPKAYKKSKSTRFRNGHAAYNYKELGTERLCDGYVLVKVGEPSEWIFRARKVWQDHNGPIPEDCVILHKNGIKDDDRIENLAMVSKPEIMNYNKCGLSIKGELELNETVLAYAKLKTKIGELK